MPPEPTKDPSIPPKDQTSPIGALPPELLVYIFKNNIRPDLLNVGDTCRNFRALVGGHKDLAEPVYSPTVVRKLQELDGNLYSGVMESAFTEADNRHKTILCQRISQSIDGINEILHQASAWPNVRGGFKEVAFTLRLAQEELKRADDFNDNDELQEYVARAESLALVLDPPAPDNSLLGKRSAEDQGGGGPEKKQKL